MSLGRRFLIGLASLVLRSQAVLIIALGTAAFCAWFVSSALNGNEETWTEQVTAWAWRTAVTFLPLGLAALVFAGPKLSANAPNPVLRIPGSMSLLVSLIGFAALSIIAASPLTIVWADVYEWLNAVGAWTELRTAWSSQFGGIVIAPFLLVVLVFFLELAPAVSMVAGSAALLILYLANAGHFPRVFLASVLVQGAFVIASFIMLDLSSHLTPLLTALIVEEVDLRPAVAWLERHDAAARVTTRHFDWLFFGYLAWVAVLFWSLKQVARHTGAVTPTNTTSPPLHLPARTAYAPRRLENRVRLGIRLAFLALGAAILVQLIQDVRAPRTLSKLFTGSGSDGRSGAEPGMGHVQ